MIVSDHNGPAGACTNNAASVIHHCEVNIEASLLSMVPAIACDTQRKYHGTGGEIENFGAIELNYTRCVFRLGMTRGTRILRRVRVRAGGSNTGSELSGDTFGLRSYYQSTLQ